MIEIKLLDEAGVRIMYNKNSLNYALNRLVYEAFENSRSLGICAFYIDGKKGVIELIKMYDDGLLPIADGLLRCALSLMLSRGVSEAYANESIGLPLLRGTGFNKCKDKWKLKLTESFFSGCGGH
jgi:hypothetical protein